MRQSKFLNNIFSSSEGSSQYLYVPYTIKKSDRDKMTITLNLTSMNEKVIKRYLNERGEGILNMLIKKTIADQDYSDGALLRIS
jgi:hypothetical protein